MQCIACVLWAADGRWAFGRISGCGLPLTKKKEKYTQPAKNNNSLATEKRRGAAKPNPTNTKQSAVGREASKLKEMGGNLGEKPDKRGLSTSPELPQHRLK